MKPVLVTGAFGQVGTRCTRILLDRGRTVIALDLRTDTSEAAAAELARTQGRGTLITGLCGPARRRRDRHPDRHASTRRDRASGRGPRAGVLPESGTGAQGQRRGHRESGAGRCRVARSARCSCSRPALRSTGRSIPTAIRSASPPRPRSIRSTSTARTRCSPKPCSATAACRTRSCGWPALLSPDMQSSFSSDHLVLMRATPGDNRMHSVDTRDVALAFANGVDRAATIAGKTLVIARRRDARPPAPRLRGRHHDGRRHRSPRPVGEPAR